MKSTLLLFCAALSLVACNVESNPIQTSKSEQAAEDAEDRPKIELVFCLDATGSMGGLIQTAKDKIWDITSAVAQSQSNPDIRLSMIFYRDRGDAFVTKVYPLTSDIDSIYNELLRIEALGGGDTPESLNEALKEAVGSVGWSSGPNVYRTVFLVGDCPPHMDYDQDVLYPVSCENAKKKSIVINTVKLGDQCTDAIRHFKEIADLTEGHYTQLDQNASDIVIETPYDDSITWYSQQLDLSRLYYGNKEYRQINADRKKVSLAFYDEMDAAANSSRASYNMTTSGNKNLYGEQELIHDLEKGKVKLEEIKPENLPDEFDGLSKDQIAKKVKSIKTERNHHEQRLKVLSEKRAKYIETEMKKSGKATFSQTILEIMRKQAVLQGVQL